MKKNNIIIIIGVLLVILFAFFLLKDRGDIVGKWNLYDGNGNIYGTYEFNKDKTVYFDVMGNTMDAKYENHGDHLVIISSEGDKDEIKYKMPNKDKLILLGEHPIELLRAKQK